VSDEAERAEYRVSVHPVYRVEGCKRDACCAMRTALRGRFFIETETEGTLELTNDNIMICEAELSTIAYKHGGQACCTNKACRVSDDELR
jgi:hypothetical protein